MVDVLPARAAGYPWINIYNSEKHGFSLHTFYRFGIQDYLLFHIFVATSVSSRDLRFIFGRSQVPVCSKDYFFKIGKFKHCFAIDIFRIVCYILLTEVENSLYSERAFGNGQCSRNYFLVFFRKMIDWDEEMSPILLIIRDCEKNVFGAVVSTTVRPCEHFFGTGDSCFLYKYSSDFELNEK